MGNGCPQTWCAGIPVHDRGIGRQRCFTFTKRCPSTSWTPEILNAPQDNYDGVRETISSNFRLYSACGASPLACASATGQNGVLVTPALQIDTIQSMSLPNEYRQLGFSRMQSQAWHYRWIGEFFRLLWWYRFATARVDEQFSDQKSRNVRRTFWRTLTWDRLLDGLRGVRRSLRDPSEADSELESMSYDGVPITTLSQDQLLRYSGSKDCTAKLASTIKRRLCRTAHGCMALIPDKSVHGNEIWILQGVPIPVVLRRMDQGQHVFVSFCYVHEMMDGQALSLPSLRFEDVYIR